MNNLHDIISIFHLYKMIDDLLQLQRNLFRNEIIIQYFSKIIPWLSLFQKKFLNFSFYGKNLLNKKLARENNQIT